MLILIYFQLNLTSIHSITICICLPTFRSPLLLTYDAAHFSALVAMDETENRVEASLPGFSEINMHYIIVKLILLIASEMRIL